MTAEQNKLWQFHGGVHPAENKAQSLGRKILSAGIPPQLTLPLSQSIGAAPDPLVQAGDKVLKGQLLAQATAYVSVPLHAPTSGTVAAIEERQIAHASGLSAQCILIDTDGKDEGAGGAG